MNIREEAKIIIKQYRTETEDHRSISVLSAFEKWLLTFIIEKRTRPLTFPVPDCIESFREFLHSNFYMTKQGEYACGPNQKFVEFIDGEIWEYEDIINVFKDYHDEMGNLKQSNGSRDLCGQDCEATLLHQR